MKNIAILICLTLGVAFSCKDDDDDVVVPTPSVNISTGDEIELSSDEQDFIIKIRSDDFDWTFKLDAEWVSADTLSGDSTVSIETVILRNLSIEPRETLGILNYIKDGVNGADTIVITQLGEPYVVYLSEPKIYSANKENELEIGVASNADYSIVETPDWAELTTVPFSQPLDTIETVIKIAENTSYAYRKGVIRLKQTDRDVVDSLEIYQFGIGSRKTDSLALVMLYNSTNGANWTNKWDLSQSMDQWNGVVISEILEHSETPVPENLQAQRVTALRLAKNNLIGAIPAEIANLAYLEYLVLNDNQLNGELPADFGNLQNLIWLELQNNQITGILPESIGSATLMDRLYLDNNQFSGTIPSSLSNMTLITSIGLSDNNFSGTLPSAMGNLKDLKVLRLNNNRLSGTIPSTFVNNDNMTNWDAESNIIPQQDGYKFTNPEDLYGPL